MKRKKQIVLYLLLMAVCVWGYLWLHDLRLSPESYFRASERMDHVGPCEEILAEADCGDGKYLMLGRNGEDLYYCMMERRRGVFWTGAGREYFTRSYLEEYDQKIMARYYWTHDFLFGICTEEDAVEVSFRLEDGEENVLLEGTLPVREDGIFFGGNIRGVMSEEAVYPATLIATDQDGNIVAKY